MAGAIFINCRRDDSLASAGRLHDRLAPAFGRKPIAARACANKRDFDQAIADYNEALRLDPKDASRQPTAAPPYASKRVRFGHCRLRRGASTAAQTRISRRPSNSTLRLADGVAPARMTLARTPRVTIVNGRKCHDFTSFRNERADLFCHRGVHDSERSCRRRWPASSRPTGTYLKASLTSMSSAAILPDCGAACNRIEPYRIAARPVRPIRTIEQARAAGAPRASRNACAPSPMISGGALLRNAAPPMRACSPTRRRRRSSSIACANAPRPRTDQAEGPGRLRVRADI